MMSRSLFKLQSRGRGLRIAGLVSASALASGTGAWALINQLTDLQIVSAVEGSSIATIGGHISQFELTNLVAAGQNATAFEESFERGDELFGLAFSATDGGGANVGAGHRYTRMPRADLKGAGQWWTHAPARATGPNAASCTGCHNQPADDGAGSAATNVHRDPLRQASNGKTIQRNPPSVFGLGALQLLAEEMTTDLWTIRDTARAALGCGVTTTGNRATRDLTSKGVAFGKITITHVGGTKNCTETLAPPAGAAPPVASDLVVRPFQWKGSVASIRDFTRGAGHNELGMQGNELLGSPSVSPTSVDGDGDGVKNELTVGDITGLAVYQAGQPRPTTRQELASLGLIPPLSAAENANIAAGSALFNQIACAVCHTPQLLINDPVFREPSDHPAFRDAGDRFPNGRTYLSAGLNPLRPISFDLTSDMLENNTTILPNGQVLGAFSRDAQGHAKVDLFGDLRQHNMGSVLAEQIDEVGTGASVFMTENLWGVGSTAPYLHDGRATTLTEAILEHGGESQNSRNAFANLSTAQKKQVIAFLNNLVLFKE